MNFSQLHIWDDHVNFGVVRQVNIADEFYLALLYNAFKSGDTHNAPHLSLIFDDLLNHPATNDHRAMVKYRRLPRRDGALR
jgi:hypothetical protein